MKDVPVEAAKCFCDQYEKDQCIILSWDQKSGETWVTTFGKGDENSIMAANAGKLLKDFLQIERESDCIPKRFEEWKIESIDRYYYASGRNYTTYVEVTFWFEVHTKQRNETKRDVTILDGNIWELPEWAKGITTRKKSLEPIFF